MKRFCKLNKKVLTLSTRYYIHTYIFIRILKYNEYKALSSSASASLKVVQVPRKLTLVVKELKRFSRIWPFLDSGLCDGFKSTG